jgi:hypothetical protein
MDGSSDVIRHRLRQVMFCGLFFVVVITAAPVADVLAKDPPDVAAKKEQPPVDSNYTNTTPNLTLTVPFKVTRDTTKGIIVLVRGGKAALPVNIKYTDKGDHSDRAPIFLKLDFVYQKITGSLTTAKATLPVSNKFAVDIADLIDQLLAAISPLLPANFDSTNLVLDKDVTITVIPAAPNPGPFAASTGTQEPKAVKDPLKIVFQPVLFDPPPSPAPAK